MTLGTLLSSARVTKMQQFIRSGTAVGLAITAALMLIALIAAFVLQWVMGVIAVIGGALALVLLILAARLIRSAPTQAVEIYEMGMIHRSGSAADTLRWDEIKQLRIQTDDVAAQRVDGSTFAFENAYRDAFEGIVITLLEQAGRVLAAPDIARLKAGEAISYGRFQIDPAARVLHLPYGDEVSLNQLELRVPLIEQRFVIFDEQAGKAFDELASEPSEDDEDDSPFVRPKWFRPYPFGELQPFPRFFAVMAYLGVPVHVVGTRATQDGATITYQHRWTSP